MLLTAVVNVGISPISTSGKAIDIFADRRASARYVDHFNLHRLPSGFCLIKFLAGYLLKVGSFGVILCKIYWENCYE